MPNRFSSLSVITGVLLINSFSLQLFSQPEDSSAKILEQVALNYKSYLTFSADFSYEIDNKTADIHESDNGKIFMMGNKYVVELSGQKIINDGENLFVYFKSQKEINISKFEKDDEDITPTNLFTFYDKNYKHLFMEEVNDHGIITQIIELAPKNRKKNIFKIRLSIDKKKKWIRSVQLFDRNGSVYLYCLNNFVPNPAELNESFFTFDKSKYPGVHIEDLR